MYMSCTCKLQSGFYVYENAYTHVHVPYSGFFKDNKFRK